MSIGEIIVYGMLGILGVYIVIRVATYAYFKSKRDFGG